MKNDKFSYKTKGFDQVNSLKSKIKDFGNLIKSKRLIILLTIAVIGIIVLLGYSYKTKDSYKQSIENNYNMAFCQLVDNVQDVEVYLAKALISNAPESGTETLTYVWREANMAQTYLSMLPVSSSELENTAKFLNQVSDYSFSLSQKTIDNKELTQSDLDNLGKLHEYSVNLKNTLNQLSVDLNDGRITWSELTSDTGPALAKEVSNISKDSFGTVEENFHEYAGLIYDGAFSEHLTNPEHRGLTGEDIDEKSAMEIAINFWGADKIKEIKCDGITENTSIIAYNFSAKSVDGDAVWISVSKKGGHIVSANSNRNVNAEIISQENIDKIVEDYLNNKGFPNMKKTYFSKNNGVETINYAYEQNGVICYPDLIKVKIAMDNGEILGIETSGYLNSHTERNIPNAVITKDEAISKINEKVDVLAIDMAVIPTEFQTELTCWEIKGKVEDRDFLVYVNIETGKEEDILVILNSAEGTLTM